LRDTLHFILTLYVFLLNDPLKLGTNTIDPAITATHHCRHFIMDNALWNVGVFVAVFFFPHSFFARKSVKTALGLWRHPLERPLFATLAWIGWFVSIYLWRPVSDCARFDVFKVSPMVAGITVPIFAFSALLLVGFLWALPDHVFGTARYQFPPGTIPAPTSVIRTFPYGLVRHPAATAFLYMYWIIPSYTANHIFLSAMWTVFILLGTWFEEGGLQGHDEFGKSYLAYRKEVSAFVPWPSNIYRVFFKRSE